MPRRLLPLLFLCLLSLMSAGCASRMSRSPVAGPPADAVELVVFNDGFHSGILSPFAPDLLWLDESDDQIAKYPWMEVGFAADDWVNAHQGGCVAKTKLVISGSPGIMMLEHYPTPARPARNTGVPVRTWKLTVSRESWTRMVAWLHDWIDLSIIRVRHPNETRWFAFSTKKWTLQRNCNDFVIEWLRAGGIESGWHWGYTAEGFCGQMDCIEAELKKSGVTVIGPPPVVP